MTARKAPKKSPLQHGSTTKTTGLKPTIPQHTIVKNAVLQHLSAAVIRAFLIACA